MADDVTLGIGARDRNARQLIRDLVNALTGLQSATAKSIAANKQAAQAAREAASGFQEQVKVLNGVRAAREAYADRIKALGRQEVEDSQRITAQTVKDAQVRAAAKVEAAKVEASAAQQASRSAQEALQAEITKQNAIVAAVERGVQIRIQRQKDLAAAEEANQAKTVARLEKTLQSLQKTQQAEKEIGAQRIRDARKELSDAQAAQKLTKAKTPERVTADAGVAAAKERLASIKEAARVQDEANTKAVKKQQEILNQEKRFASERAALDKQRIANTEKAGAREVAVAQSAADKKIAAAQRAATAKDGEARAAARAVNTEIALGRREVSEAREKANKDVANARITRNANNERASSAVKASNQEIKSARASAVEQNRRAREFEAAARRGTRALQEQAKAIPGINAGLTQLRRTVLQLVAAYGGFRVISGFVKTSLQFNTLIESARLGIAALITAEADLTDQQGRQLQGLSALKAAQGLATDQLNKLRIAGIQTAATTEDLVTAFQEAVGAGVAVGLTLDQIRQFSVSVAQAASAINLPMNQLQQETRSILQGTIDRNSRIAKALNLTNAEVNLAKQQNRLFDLLNEKFKAFNIAGVESVKTFAALRSNIADAFQVLAGQAVEPLFIRLRDAGQEALQSIFDFRSATIQKSFQGLVDAAKQIFDEIGKAFADAIRGAVRGATALSVWLTQHREIVKQTAAAVGTMVREFGDMVLEIGRVIQALTGIAGGTNAVINVARILQSIFQTIREDAALIAGFFAGRAAFSLLINIGKLVVALRGILTGAAVGSAIPGIGTAVGAIAGGLLSLHTIYNLIRGDQQRTREETARTTTALEDQARTLAGLTAEYSDNARILKDSKLSDEEKITVQNRLNEIRDKFIQAGGAYRDIFNQDKISVDELAKSLRNLLVAQTDAATQREGAARDNLFVLQQQLQKAQQQLANSVRPGPLGIGTVFDKQAADRVKALQDQINIATADVQRLSDQTDTLTDALNRSAQASVTIKAHTPSDLTSGEDPRIAQARAEFERVKAELELRRAQIQRDLAARRITNEQSLEQLLLADLDEIKAEERFVQAQKAEADRKARIAKPGSEAQRKAEDEAKAFEIQLKTLGVRGQTLTEEFNAKILDLTQARVDAETAIQVRALRAQGKALDAALLEIERETAAALDKAEQDFREFSPEVRANLKIAITHEQLEKAVKAVQEEINRIIQTRTEEERAAREEFARRGKLSDADRQQLANRIAGINQEAIESATHARAVLEQLKVTAADDPGLQTFIGRLLAELDALSAKAQKVDLEMQKLKDGFRSALEGGLTDFFSQLGDATQSLATSFRNMVNSIIRDMQRLVSQILASRIISTILGTAAGAAGGAGQAPGNTTQSGGAARGGQAIQYRAEGGPGRPPHGTLRGGIAGQDSIPILAMPEEYFIRREAVRKYGVELFDLLNNMSLPMPVARDKNRFRFAQGGLVEAPGASARVPVAQTVHHTIGVDSRGFLRILNGKVGEDAVVRASKVRRREIGSALQPQRR